MSSMKRFLAAAVAASALLCGADIKNFVENGGFEDNSEGWLYHQWDGKNMPGTFDKSEKVEGAQSFKFATPESPAARYVAKQIKGFDPAKNHIFEFSVKTEGMWQDSAYVRLSVDGSGWLGSAQGVEDLVKVGGTQGWKKYQFPVTAARLGGSSMVQVFVYNDHPDRGALFVDGIALRVGEPSELPTAAGAVSLSGDTSAPVTSTYILGQKPAVNFSVSGLKAGEKQTLELDVTDERGRSVERKSIAFTADAGGAWQSGDVATAGGRLGFYRVNAALGNGAKLAAVGSRAAGFLTYAVVPDPAARKQFPPAEATFGMQGGFGPWGAEALELLGASWVLDGEFEWIRQEREPEMAGKFKAAAYNPEKNGGGRWKSYPLPTLFMAPPWAVVPETHAYNTGRLTPEGEKAWDAYAREAAKAFRKKWAGFAPRYYQITWEPIQPWGFKGSDKDLLRIYEIAHKAIRETDPEGLVAGPCRGIDKNEVAKLESLLEMGLGKHLDAFSTHPYWASLNPEAEGMHEKLVAVRELLEKHIRPGFPMIGTEQGLSTHEDPEQDLGQARALIRQNLMTLGEGYKFNMAFYIVDYHLAGQKGYGYYYVPVPGVGWGPAKINPRPIVPAYAAQSLLIDGHKSLGRVGGLSATQLGYVFKRGESVVLALWDYGEKTGSAALPVGRDEVKVFDWMGNASTAKAPGGMLEIALGPDPVYVSGVSPALWGDAASRMLSLASKEITLGDGDLAKLSVKTKGGDRLVVAPDQRLGIAPIAVALRGGAAGGGAAGGAREITFKAPPNAKAGKYALGVTLFDKDIAIGYEGAVLEIRPPVEIAAIAGSGAASLTVRLRNTAATSHSGAVSAVLKKILKGEPRPDLPMIDLPDGKVQLVDVAGGLAVEPYTLRAGAVADIAFSFDGADIDPYSPYLAQIIVKTTGARGAERSETVSFAVLQKAKPAPKIDGDLADWAGIPAATISGRENIIRQPKEYAGEHDLAAKVRMQWDEQHLYLAMEVTDDAICTEDSGAMLWRNDCVQWAIDPSDRAASEPSKATETNIGLSPTGAPESFRAVTFDAARSPEGSLGADALKLAIRKVPGGLVYEAAYTWRSLGLDAPPKPGRKIGVAFAVNDRDSIEQTDPSALGIFGGVFPNKDSDAFGVFLLAE